MGSPIIDPRYAIAEASRRFFFHETHRCADHLREDATPFESASRVGAVTLGGQKLNAALAFLFAPDLLVLDEPTASLDPISSGVLKDKIRAERARGRTFVLTSHVMSDIEELADDILLMADGVARFMGPVQEIKILTHQLHLERAVAQLVRGEVEAA